MLESESLSMISGSYFIVTELLVIEMQLLIHHDEE